MSPSTLPPPDHLLPFAPTTNFSAPAVGVRRKTPSELRQEQLNRVVRSRSFQDGTTGALPSLGSTVDQKKNGPRLVDTRVADIFVATKPHDRPKFPFMKQKDDFNQTVPSGTSEASRAFRKCTAEEPCSVAVAEDDLPENNGQSVAVDHLYGKFRDVTQLSSRTKPQASGLCVDMAEALKVMAPAAGRGFNGATRGLETGAEVPHSPSPGINTSSDKLKTPPVDLSLKLSARFLSVDSLQWCHRISSRSEVEGIKHFVEKLKWNDKDDQQELLGENGMLDRLGARFYQALHSWVHPPPQYLELYDIALANARGDAKKSAMIASLYQMWEEAFRSLYYMFCHKQCNLFYLCTQQFVVMFERGNSGDEKGCNAYWSRSTRGLRKRLQEQGVEFSMPFCTSVDDMSTLEDLHELTEFERLHPGQTRLVDPRAAIDNNSQSLLAFEAGHLHHLFDFLLNYRYLVTSANGADFPILYSPVEFSKAFLYMPEVKCKHVQHSDESTSNQLTQLTQLTMQNGNTSNMLYSLELKGPSGAYITPWVVQAVCMVLQKSQKLGFEVSFVTGTLSEALNVAQEKLLGTREPLHTQKATESLASKTNSAGVSKNKMRVLKHLRYSDGSYQATLAALS